MSEPLFASLQENLSRLEADFKDCADYICRKFVLGACPAALLTIDGLVNKQHVSISIAMEITRIRHTGISEESEKTKLE